MMPRLETSPERARPRHAWEKAKAFPGQALQRYEKLGLKHKLLIWTFGFVNIALLVAVLIITPRRIAGWFNSFGLAIRNMGVGGMFICGLMVVLASHPPLFGFAGSMTLIGFAYGIWPGFLVGAISAVLGAGLAFVSVRNFFPGLLKSNKQWEAFGHVMREKGLPLVIMIRYCPLPWAIANGLFASVESVTLPQFLIANVVFLPRILIPVFIGSRLDSLTDPSEGKSNDTLKFWLNLISIVVTLSISFITGFYIYRATLTQMRKLEEGNLAAQALEEEALYHDGLDGDDEELDDEPLTRRGDGIAMNLGRPGKAVRRTSSSGSDQ